MKQRLAQLCLSLASTLLSAEAFEMAPASEEPVSQDDLYFDAPMQMIRSDGRDPNVKSVFQQELERLREKEFADKERSGSHKKLEAIPEVDVEMSLLWDWNHKVDMTLRNSDQNLQLIPTTGSADMTLIDKKCRTCWTSTFEFFQQTTQVPHNGTDTEPVRKKFEYFNMMHVHDVEIEGRYWQIDACLNGRPTSTALEANQTVQVCGDQMVTYSIEKADPLFYSLGNGYLGLAPRNGYDGTPDSNILNQMVKANMIKDRIFGVHTHMWNSTEDPSSIRFGGYDKQLFKEGHDQIWLDTMNQYTWLVQFSEADFKQQRVWNESWAIINPGYPFIGMPNAAFEQLKKDMEAAYTEELLTCGDSDWCYFFSPCADIAESLPDLTFTFPTKDGVSVTYSIPPKSYMFEDYDFWTQSEICHVALIRQSKSDVRYWTLGQLFMENFYTTFDASDPSNLKVGLSNVPNAGTIQQRIPRESVSPKDSAPAAVVPEPESEESDQTDRIVALTAAIVVTVILTTIFVVLIMCCCARKSKQDRLEKAQAKFSKVKTSESKEQTSLDPESEF